MGIASTRGKFHAPLRRDYCFVGLSQIKNIHKAGAPMTVIDDSISAAAVNVARENQNVGIHYLRGLAALMVLIHHASGYLELPHKDRTGSDFCLTVQELTRRLIP